MTQTSTISASISTSDTSGWSNTFGVKVGISASFKTGVPFIAEGKIKVSTEISNSYTWNGSTTTTKTWNFTTPVVVPPKSAISAVITAKRSTIVVPYTQIVILEFKSGIKVKARVEGTYQGVHCHDVEVRFKKAGTHLAAAEPIGQPLMLTASPT